MQKDFQTTFPTCLESRKNPTECCIKGHVTSSFLGRVRYMWRSAFSSIYLTSQPGLGACPQVLARSPGVNLPKWQLTGGTSWNPCGETSGSINLQWDQCSEFLIKPVSFINLQERQWFIRRASIWSRKWNSFHKPISVVQINWPRDFPISGSASHCSFNLIVLLPSIHLKASAGSLCLTKVSAPVQWWFWLTKTELSDDCNWKGTGGELRKGGELMETWIIWCWWRREWSWGAHSMRASGSHPHPAKSEPLGVGKVSLEILQVKPKILGTQGVSPSV